VKPPNNTSNIWRLAAPSPPHYTSCKQNKLAIVPHVKQSARACAFWTRASFQIHSSTAEAQCTQDRDSKNKKIKSNIKSGAGAGGTRHKAPVPCSMLARIVFACRRFDCISFSVRSLVMPHSATSSASGDDISTITTWNSGV